MNERVRQHFDRAADRFDAIYDRDGLGGWIDRHFRADMFERFRLTFEDCKNLDGKTVLDIGCGSGRYAAEFARRGARVTGIDPASRMLELARHHAMEQGVADRCEFEVAVLRDLPLDHTYDISLAVGVLDYVPEARGFLEHMQAMTRERMVLTFPSRSPIRTPIRKIRYWFKRCPVYFYNRTRIEELLAGLGQPHIVKIPGQGMDYFVTVNIH